MRPPSATEVVRDLMKDMLPDEVSVEEMFPEDPVDEALDPLGTLLSPASQSRYVGTEGLGKRVDDYRKLLQRQKSLRESYRLKLDKLLTQAEKSGPRARKRLLNAYEEVAQSHLLRARQHGLSLMTKSKRLVQDPFHQKYISDRAAHDRLHFEDFLNSIWNKTEKMGRDQRRDLYVDNLDAMFHEGAIAGLDDETTINWRLSPAEHCFDCIGLAAGGPYSKPGAKNPGYEILPTSPRRGDTQCLANCKCYLTFTDAETDTPKEPGQRTGADAYDEETGEELFADDESSRAVAIKEIDLAREEAQYAKAMHELTGQDSWLKTMREANGRIIDLSEEYGIRSVPRSESDLMARKMGEALEGGWMPVLSDSAGRLGTGQFASVLKGGIHHRGTISEWDPNRGVGTFKPVDGDEFAFGTADRIPTIVFDRGGVQDVIKGKTRIADTTQGSDIAVEFAGKPATYTEQAIKSGFNPTGSSSVIKRVLDNTDPKHYYGLDFKVAPKKTRPKSKAFDMPDGRKTFGETGIEVEKDRVTFRGSIKDPTRTKYGLFGKRTVTEAIGASLYKKSLKGKALAKWRRIVDDTPDRFFIDRQKFLNDDGYMSAFGESYWRFKSQPAKLRKQQPSIYDFMAYLLDNQGMSVEIAVATVSPL